MKKPNIKIVLASAFCVIVLSGAIYFAIQGTKKTSSNTAHIDTSKNTQQSVNVNDTAINETTSSVPTAAANEIGAVKKDNSNENSLSGIEFVKYKVNKGDTLWKIAHTYMPDYNAYPVEDKAGVISFIVKENNLKMDSKENYILYTGSEITIPKQKEISLK